MPKHVSNGKSCYLSGILDQKFKMRLGASMGHSKLTFMYKHVQLRSFNHEIWLGKGLHMLFMSMHVQLEPFTPVMWLWKGLHMLSMENPVNFPQVGHLRPRFQNEAMYINGPLQTLIMRRHVKLKIFTHEIWLWKGLHMLSMGNPVTSRRSAILD